jgi:hypothetical protein
MTWRGPTTPRDPLLDTPLYRRNRPYLKKMRLPCAVCGKVIDYTKSGAFVAGHIVSRRKVKLLGWTEAQTNSLANLRSECRSCSNTTGVRERAAGAPGEDETHPARQDSYGDDSRRW